MIAPLLRANLFHRAPIPTDWCLLPVMSKPALLVRHGSEGERRPIVRWNTVERKKTMKFMLLLKATEESESGQLPDEQAIAEMGRYNDELIQAGVLLAGEGLHASADGARVRYDGERRSVVDGPFAETKELLAGFWILEVSSKEEAVEWARRIPLSSGEVEVRQVFMLDEFDQDGEYVQREREWREQHGEARTA
jgi:hypothetical protein